MDLVEQDSWCIAAHLLFVGLVKLHHRSIGVDLHAVEMGNGHEVVKKGTSAYFTIQMDFIIYILIE